MGNFVGKNHFFGKHLIDKALVTELDVLEALELQRGKSQTFEKAALKLGIMNPNQVFKVLTYQADSDLGFEEIALKLGLISGEQADRIISHIENKKPFLGLTLVKLGKLPMQAMEKELDEFEQIVEKHQAIAENLHKIVLFRHLRERTLESLAYITEIEQFDERQKVIGEGDEVDRFYCVSTGSLEVTKQDTANAGQPYVYSICEGDVFGESCIFESSIHCVSVTAQTSTTLFSFRRNLFIEFIKNHPKDSISIFIFFIQRLMYRLECTDKEPDFVRSFGVCQDRIERTLKEFFE